MMDDRVVAVPSASAMLEALRGVGYSVATALADIIDNSVAAHADRVDLLFDWAASRSTIRVLDNGSGMSDDQLASAMKLGERSPLDARAQGDLGRFGLGLKTASFSQCRRLTVASRKDGVESCLRWDLDLLGSGEGGGWYMWRGTHVGSQGLLEPLNDRRNGTLVIWEELDRIVTRGVTQRDFLDVIDRVEQHLAMVFHRYLQGPRRRLTITINGRSIVPWDPFLSGHPATRSSPVERIQAGTYSVEVESHVLPHRDRLTQADHDAAAGPNGWTAQQGFYVYRAERLLVAGDWLGLGGARPWTREEVFRLARIRVDIPIEADADWKIDIRKSRARPPVSIRQRLTALAEDARFRARRVFAHRGESRRAADNGTVEPVWEAHRDGQGLRYRISQGHPVVKSVLEDAGPLAGAVVAMLRVIEESVPVQRIWLDTAEQKEVPRTGFDGEPPAEVRTVLEVVYRRMLARGAMSPMAARRRLLTMEPFQNYPALVEALPDTPASKENA